MHRKPSRVSRKTKVFAFLATFAAVLLGFGLSASAAPGTTSVSWTGKVYACYVPLTGHAYGSLTFHGQYTGTQKCGTGHSLVVWNLTPPATVTAPSSTRTGTTSLSAWPESSGWANDAFTRGVSVTRVGAVDNANCSGAPKCFFYTFTLTDNGSFTTVNGTPTPNGTGGTVHGVTTGTMQGVAIGSFYGDTDALTGTIPATATGAAKPASTTNWATLALPASAHTYGVKLTQYGWTYVDATTCETWVDKINPGDDGQSAADGNITGVVACS